MAGYGQHFLALQRLETPSANEYLAHPDYRQISSFFLGWVFFSSMHYLFRSSFLRYMSRCIAASFVHHWSPSEKHNITNDNEPVEYRIDGEQTQERRSFWRTDTSSETFFMQEDHPTLVFLLTLLFALSSLAQFGSLSIFRPSVKHPDTLCVAWSGMSFQSAHYVGLWILGLDLRSLGAKTWESVIFWFWFCIGTALVFASSGISNGTLSVVQTPAPLDLTFCYRRHFFPTAIALSLVSICLEIYCLFRLTQILVPSFLKLKHKMDAMKDIRIAKAISLLILDLLTIVPSSIPTNILADFIPFSIGAVIVMVVYNCHDSSPNLDNCFLTSFPPTRVPSMNVSSRYSETGISIHTQATAQTVHPLTTSLKVQVPRLSYVSSDNGSHEDIPQTARTDWTIDSRIDAVVQIAAPMARRSVRVRHLPPMPELKSQHSSPINMPQSLPFDLESAAVLSQQRRKYSTREELEVPIYTGGNTPSKKVSFSQQSIPNIQIMGQKPLSIRHNEVTNGSSRHLSAMTFKPVVFYESSTRSKSEGSLVHPPEDVQPFGEDLTRRVLQLTGGPSSAGAINRHEDTNLGSKDISDVSRPTAF